MTTLLIWKIIGTKSPAIQTLTLSLLLELTTLLICQIIGTKSLVIHPYTLCQIIGVKSPEIHTLTLYNRSLGPNLMQFLSLHLTFC